MNPQRRLNELFLKDVFEKIRGERCDAVDCFSRLRLYIFVSGSDKTARSLMLENGFTSRDYDALLGAYNRQLVHRDD